MGELPTLTRQTSYPTSDPPLLIPFETLCPPPKKGKYTTTKEEILGNWMQ